MEQEELTKIRIKYIEKTRWLLIFKILLPSPSQYISVNTEFTRIVRSKVSHLYGIIAAKNISI
jgi:hypothetical protein